MNRLMRPKNRKANCKGFTLVELIVVLVILAILAAILIPALLGWIDRAREKQDLLNAKNCLTAIQAGLSEEYGVSGGDLKLKDSIIPGTTAASNQKTYVDASGKQKKTVTGDVNIIGTSFADKVLETIDKDNKQKNGTRQKDNPYLIMFAVGSNMVADNEPGACTKHEKYTVIYLLYQETKDSTPLFYFNGTWSKTCPRANDNQSVIDAGNFIQAGSMKGKKLQYYILKYGNAKAPDSNYWTMVNGYK